MFVVIQANIFLYVWPRKVKSKMLIKILNRFIQYFNGVFDVKLLDAKCPDRKSLSLL